MRIRVLKSAAYPATMLLLGAMMVASFIMQGTASAGSAWHKAVDLPESCQRMTEGGAPPIAVIRNAVYISCPDGVYVIER